MKSTKEIAELNAAFEAGIHSRRYTRRGIKPHKFSGEMPSPAQLATLAASLARAPVENLETLCATALNLWFASHETLALQQQCNADFEREQLEAAQNPLPEPPENQAWPMVHDTFCKILWPDEDTGDRAKIIKTWLQANPIGVSYEAMRSDPIDKRQFYHLRDLILPWYQTWRAAQTSAHRSENAKKRHRKARPPREKLREIGQEWGEA
jgi:hypothetical protein